MHCSYVHFAQCVAAVHLMLSEIGCITSCTRHDAAWPQSANALNVWHFAPTPFFPLAFPAIPLHFPVSLHLVNPLLFVCIPLLFPGTLHLDSFLSLLFLCIPLQSAGTLHSLPGTLHPLPYIPLVFPFFLLLSSDILHRIPCIPVHSPGTYYTYLYITLASPFFPWHHGLTSIRPPGIPLHSLSTLNYLAYIVQAFPGTLCTLDPLAYVPLAFACIPLAHFNHSLKFSWCSPAFTWNFALALITLVFPCISQHIAGTLQAHPYISQEFPCIPQALIYSIMFS